MVQLDLYYATLGDDRLRDEIEHLVPLVLGDDEAVQRLRSRVIERFMAAVVEARLRDLRPGPRAADMMRGLGVVDADELGRLLSEA